MNTQFLPLTTAAAFILDAIDFLNIFAMLHQEYSKFLKEYLTRLTERFHGQQ